MVFAISDNISTVVSHLFPTVSITTNKLESLTRASISADSHEFVEFVHYIVKQALVDYFANGNDAFGCCHLYEQCSNEKKCVHENRLYARGCTYGKHLAKGRIFYGKNRNV